MRPDPKTSGPNPQTFLFLIGGSLGHREVGPSSLAEMLAANLVLTENCSSLQMIVLDA